MNWAAAVAAAPLDDSRCLASPYLSVETDRQRELEKLVSGLRVALSEFPSLIAILDETGPTICISENLILELGYFVPDENRIYLAPDLSPGLALATFIHELRHADQHSRGICPSQELTMRNYAKGVLALEADANVVVHLVAWRQRELGDPAIWEALESWPSTSDIAKRFRESMGTEQSVAAAAEAAFEAWYRSETRREEYYIQSSCDYLDRMDSTHELPKYKSLSPDFFHRLCILPSGEAYQCYGLAINPR